MKIVKDPLGDRIKNKYEANYSLSLLPLVPTVCRLDGKCFKSFTRNLNRPYDMNFINLMIATTKYLVESVDMCVIGYTQSDEITLILYSDNYKSEIFFNGKHSKLVSILASRATAVFNKKMKYYLPDKYKEYADIDSSPEFDNRAFVVPSLEEACNALLWREKDATRNSVSMLAQSCYSHKQLYKKSTSDMHEMLFQKGINWNDQPTAFKKGSYLRKVKTYEPLPKEIFEKIPITYKTTVEDLSVIRHEVKVIDLPPLSKISNRVDVIFNNQEPILKDEPTKTS